MHPNPTCFAVVRAWRWRSGWFAWGALGILAFSGGLLAGHPPPASAPPPLINGQPESCLGCHTGMTGFAPGHDPNTIGCAICHLGDRLARDATKAHAAMTRTPGNLSLVRQTCATAACHAAIGDRVRGSLMNTMSGVVAVDKFVFGENPDLNRPFVVSQLGQTPADTHVRTLCASCHLGTDKPAPGAIDESSRGGGCSACHLDYGPRALEELARRGRPGLTPLAPQAHPLISVRIPDQACFGCHSRSGRIATNYEGWHETQLAAADVPTPHSSQTKFRVLPDGRVFEKMPADVHFTRGLSCTDCHLAAEVMGDGLARPHEENAVQIACLDCHSDQPPATKQFGELDPETQMLVALRGLGEPGRRYVIAHSGQAAYPNVFVDAAGTTKMAPQRSGTWLQPRPVSTACGRKSTGHATLDCRTCHSSWASQCVSCHTESATRTAGWDHLADRPTTSSWQESAAKYFADPPTLGVVTEPAVGNGPGHTRITTVVPGMILTLIQPPAGAKPQVSFHRLFAPASPHTTASKARDCQSCHANPSALGYGRGTLSYEVTGSTGRWRFIPELAALPQDGLPADAWIGFLQTRPTGGATRDNLRPFNVEEQRRILQVGACLTCHQPDSAVMREGIVDFEATTRKRSPRCAFPVWP